MPLLRLSTRQHDGHRAPRKAGKTAREEQALPDRLFPAFPRTGVPVRAGGVPPPCPGPACGVLRFFCIAQLDRHHVLHAESCFVSVIRNALRTQRKISYALQQCLHAASEFFISSNRFNETLYERSGKRVPFRYGAWHDRIFYRNPFAGAGRPWAANRRACPPEKDKMPDP